MSDKYYTKFNIRINYKSGIQEEYWFYAFSIERGNVYWTPVAGYNKPIIIGVDNIESVVQLSVIEGVDGLHQDAR